MNLLDVVLQPEPPPFAILYRPQSTDPDRVEIIIGEVSTPDTLADVELSDATGPYGTGAGPETLLLLPHRQIAERGFSCVDDGSPLVAMKIADHASVPLGAALPGLPVLPIRLLDSGFVPSDDEYRKTVGTIVTDVIGKGEGSNFVVKRSFATTIADYTIRRALSLFRRLLEAEAGAYWTFIVHTGARTFVGATPERHLTLHAGVATMNPMSGTYRYPPSGPVLSELIEFLADRKETEELYMVVDEELKMMARISDSGARAVGPYLLEMARVAHTAYIIEGHTTKDPRDILRETMFAPTVTGSPLESACRVITRYEPSGRGYYGGVAALIGRDEAGRHTLDSSILIRTADIDAGGRVDVGVGATLVRHSDPSSEVAETRAKAASLIAALTAKTPSALGDHPDVQAALARRNGTISAFWLGGNRPTPPEVGLAGRRVLIVDGEDSFTSMLEHQLRWLGLVVTVRRYDEPYTLEEYDLVVMGPGPGDPREGNDPKISALSAAIDSLLNEHRPFLAICLSHQLLSLRLGLELERREVTNQGVQREIDLFGSTNRVGFYNTFAASSQYDALLCDGVGRIAVSRDESTGEVHALRGPHFASMQFHPESVLTQDGVSIVADLMREVLHL